MINTRQAGRAFVKKVIAELKELDQATYEVTGSGSGLDKGDLRIPRFDIVGECKDAQQIAMALWITQAERQGLQHSRTALFWRNPRSPKNDPEIRVDISMIFFKELLARFAEPVIKKEDREFKYKIQRLRQDCQAVLKELGNANSTN